MESGLPAASALPPPHPPSLAARQRGDGGRKMAPGSTTPAFLSNLGKATLRGIRKCPQCGVYNGTRGLSCKNKACGVVFKEGGAAGGGGARGGAKRGAAMEVVRVVMDDGGEGGEGGGGGESGGAQVFSVCQRGRGAGAAPQRGFVELVPTDTAIATGDGATLLTRVNVGRCFLPACRQQQQQGQRSNRTGRPPPPPSKRGSSSSSLPGNGPCVHIKRATECQDRATPLPLKSSVLEGLPVSPDAQNELWSLATESPGPLVQRVSRDTVVVKCRPGPGGGHPLGLLHLTVGCGPSSAATAPEPCLHFYACVCAFASDDKLAAEFAAFLDYGSNGLKTDAAATDPASCPSDKPPEPVAAQRAKRPRLDEPITAPSVVCPVGGGTLRRPGQRRPPVASLPKTPGAHSECSGERCYRTQGGPWVTEGASTGPGSSLPVDERQVTQGFQQWLASVTERIHQTMHYQFDGKPEPLVFHIPQAFFDALQHRLSLGSKKRRLPNATTVLERNDSLPVGSFSKYTWHFTSLVQVKRIFDTPELPLELTQSFVRNSDGSCSPFRCPQPPPAPPEGPSRGERPPPQAIRPLELRTFLKVGVLSADQEEGTPFVVEWIPDVLPLSGVGELRISFQYGHQLCGQPDYCDAAAARHGGGGGGPAERGGRSKMTSSDSS